MDKRTATYLWDALDACNLIETFLVGIDLEKYFADVKTQAAVERKLEVIGEALNRVAKHDPNVAGQIEQLRSAVDLRNIISHRYDSVKEVEIFEIATGSVPLLSVQLRAILPTLDDFASSLSGSSLTD